MSGVAVRADRDSGVAVVTLNRPERLNAVDLAMADELASTWGELRFDDSVRAIVLTGAGERAFCTGIDRDAAVPQPNSPYAQDDPLLGIGPKANDLWKPVICAVNGMACGGAFYMLAESDIVIAADHATFFDPHVTYGQAAVYEPIKMLQHISLGNVLRMSLLGAHERISAHTALQIGLVTQVVAADELAATAEWIAETVASVPANVSSGTLRAVWAANDLGRLHALSMAPSILSTATDKDVMRAGNDAFENQPRVTPRIR